MALYTDYETGTSFGYIKKIINILDEPICILGGWAVYLTVNQNFKHDQGANYHGSRDIDLGFYLDATMDERQLTTSVMKKALHILEENGFQGQGFRYYKEIKYGTNKELTKEEAEKTPSHDIFTMYVDPIVNFVHPLFKHYDGWAQNTA